MSKIIDIGVERDHIEAQTKANGLTALSELIWNSLDADATEIHVEFKRTGLGGFEYLIVKDNGHGLTYEKAQEVFSRLGGSEKKNRTLSPNGRAFHGKEGRGRYKSLALGDLVEFVSVYKHNKAYYQFSAKIDRNQLSRTEISDLKELQNGQQPRFEVRIHNVHNKNAALAIKAENRKDLEERFASYWINYPTFQIFFNGSDLEFASLIRHTDQLLVKIEKDNSTYPFINKLIEWTFENKKKAYLCSTKGIPFLEINLGIRAAIPISVFIQSAYIEKLHRNNILDFWEADDILQEVHKRSKSFAREYIRKRLHQYSKEFIDELKAKGIYPYKDPPENLVEETKRQVFDILALQINEHFPSFTEQDDKSKQLTLILIREALENDAKGLRKIFSDIIELPMEKRDELIELLEATTLPNIIDTSTEIKNRLVFLQALEQIVYDKELNRNVKERKHLHKIISKETWIFGDEYSYGVDDLSLKNVLKTYLKECLGRDDFEEVLYSANNSLLEVIPDVCMWQQFSLGTKGKENLVVELKRPTVDAGFKERSQIELYASRVSNDPRFPKASTRWKFFLITRDIKPELEPHLNQKNRKYGHVSEGENFDVFILRWGDIITEAKTRHEFIKDKLNLNLQDNEESMNYITAKYKEYLPSDFGENLDRGLEQLKIDMVTPLE